MALDLAVLVFDSLDGAERAYAEARERARDAPWIRELAFVEHHPGGRITFRGTFAGHYLDVEDVGEFIGRDTVVGALTGALLGAIFGPPGFAAGLVGGGAVGGFLEATHVPAPHGPLFDEVRRDVPEGSSAVVLLAAPGHVDAMVQAFDGLGGRLVRRTLSDDVVAALVSSVTGAPPVRDEADAHG